MGIDAYTKYMSGEPEEEKKNDVIEGFDVNADYVAEVQEAHSTDSQEDTEVPWMDGSPGGARPAEKASNREERFRDAV